MTPLRQRMIEDLQLQGYSDSTQTLYVNAVLQLCEHYNKCPGQITEEELRDYFLYGDDDRPNGATHVRRNGATLKWQN